MAMRRSEVERSVQSVDLDRKGSTARSQRPATVDPSPFSRPPAEQNPIDRNELIAVAAYYLAEQRGFAPGHEVEDWLAAEQQIAARAGASRH